MRLSKLALVPLLLFGAAACQIQGTDGASAECATPAPNQVNCEWTLPTPTTAAPTPTTPAPTTPAPTTPAPTTPPPSNAWPIASNTGATGAMTSEQGNGDECAIGTPNIVLENVLFNCTVVVSAPGVVIRNSIVRGGSWWGVENQSQTGTPLLLEDVSICSGPTSGTLAQRSVCNPPTAECSSFNYAVGYGNYRANGVKVVNFNEGFRVEESGNNVIVTDSYVKLCAFDPEHADGIQGYIGGSATQARPIRFEHNTIDMRCGLAWSGMPGADNGNLTGDPADKSCANTSAWFWSDNSGNGFELKNNLLSGAGYTIRGPAGSGHTVSDNVVERDTWAYGPSANENCGGMSWSNNKLVDVDWSTGQVSNAAALSC
jgi:hypothetical protein